MQSSTPFQYAQIYITNEDLDKAISSNEIKNSYRKLNTASGNGGITYEFFLNAPDLLLNEIVQLVISLCSFYENILKAGSFPGIAFMNWLAK